MLENTDIFSNTITIKKLFASHYNSNISKLLFYARFTFQYDLFSSRIINPAINCCSQLGSLHKEVADHLDNVYGPFPLTALALSFEQQNYFKGPNLKTQLCISG